MRLTDYQKLALRTESSSTSANKNFRLLHAAMGLVTEVSEYTYESDTTIDLKEEIGDCFWYIAIGCSAIKLNIEDISEQPIGDDYIIKPRFFKRQPPTLTGADSLIYWSAFLLDKMKRHLYYNEELDLEGIAMVLGQIVYDLLGEAGDHLEIILEKNIEKLKKRYPKKYTDEHAINRDTNKERRVFDS
jgi:NTP pyrophosphatase (non-canonical NTP hydrolase)